MTAHLVCVGVFGRNLAQIWAPLQEIFKWTVTYLGSECSNLCMYQAQLHLSSVVGFDNPTKYVVLALLPVPTRN